MKKQFFLGLALVFTFSFMGCATEPATPDPTVNSYVPYLTTCGTACPATHDYTALPTCKAKNVASDNTKDCPPAKLVTDCYCTRKREVDPTATIKL